MASLRPRIGCGNFLILWRAMWAQTTAAIDGAIKRKPRKQRKLPKNPTAPAMLLAIAFPENRVDAGSEGTRSVDSSESIAF